MFCPLKQRQIYCASQRKATYFFTKAEESVPTSNFPLPTSAFQPPTSHFPPPTSHCPLPTSYFPLPIWKLKTAINFRFVLWPKHSESLTALPQREGEGFNCMVISHSYPAGEAHHDGPIFQPGTCCRWECLWALCEQVFANMVRLFQQARKTFFEMVKPGDWARLSYSQSICPEPVALNESSDCYLLTCRLLRIH